MKYISPNILCCIVFIAVSCNNEVIHEEEPLAKVLDVYLYPSDIEDEVPENLNNEDSMAFLNNFIHNWIKKQLMIKKAEINLAEKEKDIQKQLAEYRASLLIHRYHEQYIRQKMDTTVGEDEIAGYYEMFADNFLLKEHVVQALLIKVSRKAPEIYKVRQLYRSDDPEDLNDLELYCYNHAEQYSLFNDRFITLSELLEQVPANIYNHEHYLKNYDYIQTRDSGFYYFVHILDYRLKNDTAPLSLVKQDIRNMVLAKRKIKCINDIENRLYQDAKNQRLFEIYLKN